MPSQQPACVFCCVRYWNEVIGGICQRDAKDDPHEVAYLWQTRVITRERQIAMICGKNAHPMQPYPVNYVLSTYLKMEYAMRLIREDQKLVTEAARILGYKNPHHFSAAFKKKFGLCPSAVK